MSNKNFHLEENEILSGDDEKICELLANLKRVDAPKNFDFGLKARIAESKTQDFSKPRLFPVLCYIAPLGLAIIVLAVFVVNGLYSFDNDSVAKVDENLDKPTVENVSLPNNSQPERFVATGNSKTEDLENPGGNLNLLYKDKKEINPFSKSSQLAASTRKPKNVLPKVEDDGVGSKDSTSTSPPILVPQEFSSNNSFQVKDVLSIIGIEASFSDKKWKVESVVANSLAGKGGVKVNDIIEAIDGNSLSGETIPAAKTFNGNLTVVRGGKTMEISLQKK